MQCPDTDTGYLDPEERFYAQDAAHEEAEEARDLEELAIAHAPNSDPDYAAFAIALACMQAIEIEPKPATRASLRTMARLFRKEVA
jgi:hypothetical protein